MSIIEDLWYGNIGTFDSNNPNIHYQKKTTSNRAIWLPVLEIIQSL